MSLETKLTQWEHYLYSKLLALRTDEKNHLLYEGALFRAWDCLQNKEDIKYSILVYKSIEQYKKYLDSIIRK